MERDQICRQTAEKLRAFAARLAESPVLLGFDGFVDTIIRVVDKREDADRFSTVRTITQFGEKVLDAANQSSNYELIIEREKLGGNGPIMANALARLGVPVRYIGALGHPQVHPVFAELTSQAECISIANPGLTDALEFEDGKLMLGKLQTLNDVNWQTVTQVVGEQALRTMVESSCLVGMVNWTMLQKVDEIWDHLAQEILPGLAELPGGRRKIFVDLADPEKRTAEALLAALERLSAFQQSVDMVLGLNLKESEQVAEALGLPVKRDAEDAVEATAAALRQALGIHGVVIHPRTSAAAAWLRDGKPVSAWFSGPLVETVRIQTGGGDHFNAGFCLAWLAGLTVEEALCAGVCTSGYYVGHAASPNLADLMAFMASSPKPAVA